MKKFLLLNILLVLFLNGICQDDYWQQKLDYKIKVTLIDSTHTLQGEMSLSYQNQSPDTLTYIWFHVYPNAFKNDKTAFSDQVLENGSTAFYFSTDNQKGYMNRLNFSVDGTLATIEDHPQHQDIIKLKLPKALAPKERINISTGFQVRLPLHFSRMGYYKNGIQATYWYPKPAVYDKLGWHEMPYLDQGEFYSEFANYEVSINLPKAYEVAAGAELIAVTEASGLNNEWNFKATNQIDFAWFADKDFKVQTDSLLLNNQPIKIKLYHYTKDSIWDDALQNIKDAINTKSQWLGSYPYKTVSVVESNVPGNTGGMEYPAITFISSPGNKKMLNYLINHEIGHNWFYAILASNERMHPWMDEGMTSFYDEKYMQQMYGEVEPDFEQTKTNFITKRLPESIENTLLRTVFKLKQDQPIETNAENFTNYNYNLIAYTKTAKWLKKIEAYLGEEVFNAAMKNYYQTWKFKHPYPKDFKNSLEAYSKQNLDSFFNLLTSTGSLETPINKKIKFTSFFNLKNTEKYNYIFIAPAAGVNYYDGFMPGVLFHNYNLPPSNLQFFVSGLYGTKSKRLNGLANISYTAYLAPNGKKLMLGIAAASFTVDNFKDSTGATNLQPYRKIVPSLKFVFTKKQPRSTLNRYLQWKTFFINETGLLFTRDTFLNVFNISYPKTNRIVNQLKFVVEQNRVLYPYRGSLEINQGKGFIRAGFTGNYFFNYVKEGGLELRLFAGKFFYTSDKSFSSRYKTDRYQLTLSGAKGYEDFTYENYFYGRNEFEGFANQQIRIKDGGFKVRTDLLSNKIGKTDNWLAAINLNSTVPKSINPLTILPIKIPLKVFADIGTYAEAWDKNSGNSKILYDAGLQLTLLQNSINIYFPLIYSKVYGDYFKSTLTEKRFIKNISFSIDLNTNYIKKQFPQLNF